MVPNKLADLRRRAGYTQQELADILGIERSTYTCYETGKAKIPIEKVHMLSVVYNVPLDYFITYEGDFLNDPNKPELNVGPEAFWLSAEERVFLAQIRLLISFGKLEDVKKALNQLSREL